MNLITKAVIRFSLVTVFLIGCTFFYSQFEDQPSKILSYFISTLLLSILLGGIFILIIRLSKSSRIRFLNEPYLVILVFIFMIGVGRIVAVNKTDFNFNQKSSSVDEGVVKSGPLRFIDEEHEVSFSYPSNWMSRNPQRKSTLVLLYESTGTNATCNLSMVSQDQEKIENYDVDYFRRNLLTIHSTLENLSSNLVTVNGKIVSWTTYETLIETKEGSLKTKFITLTALHMGKRFMLIITVPSNLAHQIEYDVETITESLQFG